MCKILPTNPIISTKEKNLKITREKFTIREFSYTPVEKLRGWSACLRKNQIPKEYEVKERQKKDNIISSSEKCRRRSTQFMTWCPSMGCVHLVYMPLRVRIEPFLRKGPRIFFGKLTRERNETEQERLDRSMREREEGSARCYLNYHTLDPKRNEKKILVQNSNYIDAFFLLFCTSSVKIFSIYRVYIEN